MSKRRSQSGDEVSLFPFLSILACLIGALIMIIVVLCVAQTQQTDGRTPEEMEMAKEYQRMQEQQKLQEEQNKDVTQLLTKLEEIKEEMADKAQRVARLRKLVDTGADIQKMNEEISQNLLKELDNLIVEIEGLNKQEKEVNEEIKLLLAELEKRQIPKDKPVPPVMVQPGGSGLAEGTKVFFVELSGSRITIFWDADKKTILGTSNEVIAADVAYNEFLKMVKAVPKAKIIYLLRDDGMGTFNKAAGWAMATYEFGVEQIGRLPIPGRGDIDLKMFNKFLGTLTPPEGAKIVAPAPSAPAAAN